RHASSISLRGGGQPGPGRRAATPGAAFAAARSSQLARFHPVARLASQQDAHLTFIERISKRTLPHTPWHLCWAVARPTEIPTIGVTVSIHGGVGERVKIGFCPVGDRADGRGGGVGG